MIRRFTVVNGWVLPAVLLVIVFRLAVAAPSAAWITLENCRLVPNPANDGDSFHVRVGDKEYIFRLYFVDAPETDAANPARLIEQAKYFGISVPQVIDVGETAKSFARDKLAESFIVITRMANAMGRSRSERFYALIETKEGDLGEQLVENGLARPFGRSAKPPGLESSKAEWEKLEQLENEAKQQRIGGWGENLGRLNVRAHKEGNTSLAISFFSNPQPVLTPAAFSGSAVISPTPASSPQKEPTSSKLDVNSASEEQLETIPGIGPALASRIIAARPFKSADDLQKVKGIGNKKRYEEIRRYFN